MSEKLGDAISMNLQVAVLKSSLNSTCGIMDKHIAKILLHCPQKH
jgi:hypothetical protein